MNLRCLLRWIAMTCLWAACGPAVAKAPRPNVLIILADDLGFSDVGCYGGEIATPNLDGLAEGGLRFTQFYNTARCWPSRAALLTGYYAQQVGRDADYEGLSNGKPRPGHGTRPAWAPLLPAILRPLGYRSYHSGKWHLDGKSLDNGFDHSYRLEDHNRYFSPGQHFQDDKPLPAVPADADYYVTVAIADHAIRCLREHQRAHAETPFFSYVAFTSPHFPLHALQKDIDRYRDTYLSGWNAVQSQRAERQRQLGITTHQEPEMERELGPPYAFADVLEKLGPGEILRPLPWDELSPVQQRFQATKMAIHAAMIDRMDQEIGRILEQVKAMQAWENTLILFASDNGASAEIMVRGDGHDQHADPGSRQTFLCLGPGFSSACNTPLRRHKTWVHEGGISTPLIAHWPAGIPSRGQLRHTAAHVIDIVPTVVELAGGPWPTDSGDRTAPEPPGRSLSGIFVEDGAPPHECLWWCHDHHRAVRVGDWKAVAPRGQAWELYDMSHDRGESHDLAGEKPEKVQQLEALWTDLARQFREQSGAEDR